MTSFDRASQVEATAMAAILPWLDRWFRVIPCSGESPLARQLQLEVGDLFVLHPTRRWLAVEVKAEAADLYGNFFLETWSNRRTRREGWFRTSHAHVILYYFVKTDELYVLDLPALQSWATDIVLARYPEKLQDKYEQANDTWGRCVPVGHVLMALGDQRARKFHPRKSRSIAA